MAVDTTTAIEIIAGDSYLNADSRAFTWTGSFSPDPTGATLSFVAVNEEGAAVLSATPSAVSASTLRLEVATADTAALAARKYDYEIQGLVSAEAYTYVRVEKGLTVLEDWSA